VQGPALDAKSVLGDAAARTLITQMLDKGTLHADANSLFMLILPNSVTASLDGEQSCSAFCGYHESCNYHGIDVAYAILPSPVGCARCGNGQIGDFTAVYAHGFAEAATDKVPGSGWVADDGQENGNLEAWILFSWGLPTARSASQFRATTRTSAATRSARRAHNRAFLKIQNGRGHSEAERLVNDVYTHQILRV
jgi:hypothetical protein